MASLASLAASMGPAGPKPTKNAGIHGAVRSMIPVGSQIKPGPNSAILGQLRGDTQAIARPQPVSPPAPAGPQFPTFPTLSLPQIGVEGGGYDEAFQASLKTARSGVEAQLRNALGEVARQEAAQQEMVNQLPGQLTGLYGQATAQAQQFGKEADAAQAAVGPGPGTSSAGAISPLLAAMAMGNATQQAGVPTLGLAVKDSAARQRGGLVEARMEALAQLDAEERQAAMQRGEGSGANAIKLAAMQNDLAMAKFSAETEEARRKEDLAVTDRHRKEDRKFELARLGASTKSAPKSAPKFGAKEISVERGAALSTGPRLRKDSAYTKLIDKLRGRTAEEVPAVVAAFEKRHKGANSQAMSVALFDLFGAGTAKK